jgi:two-component system, OmpR family, response regulator
VSRILIVEDDPFFADVLACTLRLEGHETIVANSAGDGLRLGMMVRPDLIIADWLLRNSMNGGEVCRRIRAVWPCVKVIIITGHQELLATTGLYSDLAEAVVAKPFHKEEILGVVRAALNRSTVPPPVQLFDASRHEDVLQGVY